MKSISGWVIAILLLAAAAGGGYWFGHRGAAATAEPAAEAESGGEKKTPPVATVAVTPIRRGQISRQVTDYGTIVAPPSEVRVISVAYEAQVTRLLVAPGEVVSAGQSVAEIEGSPATQLLFQEAQSALAAAQRDLNVIQERLNQHLATNTELFAAQTTEQSAQLRLDNLKQNGAAGPQQLKADAQGVVNKVDVQAGQVVPAGGPLVEIAANNQIMARLGVDPRDVPMLKPGQSVVLHRISDPTLAAITGTIHLIGQRVDPTTRLVDVQVQPPAGSQLLLDDFVSGQMTLTTADGLIVPRDAVLPGDNSSYYLFTVKNNKAVKHAVQVGIETDRETQVTADDLASGESVVVSGTLELDDGMDVQAEPSPKGDGS